MVGLTRASELTGTLELLWLVPALPLAGAAVNLFVGKRLGRAAGWLASLLVLASFAIGALAVRDLLALPAEERLVIRHLFDWITVGSFTVGADLRLDAVSAVMILVVTGVGALIHIYSIGYMEGDARFGRFFAYLNLFVFFMLMLVLGANYLILYLGWEGVGLCSYLLIGFWFEQTENANAAKKAFVVTRIGDTAMLIGLAFIVWQFGTLDFEPVFGAAASELTQWTATAIALLLFGGAIGKSAQVPLHVWLPDAMAGPTPVSALIHAATMVTAGVYLVIRSAPIFEVSDLALPVVLTVGLITALFAGTVALGQTDIKRVLAYSTISQLGFMFMAAGMRAYAAAMFMLVAHAFYKALMFLGSGSVIHGVHSQDMRQMGGLLRRMPVTGWTFIVGALALAGVPPLAGFFAKDQILELANHTGRPILWILGTFGALLSALYIGRLVALTFLGSPRSEGAEAAHESPAVMTLPLIMLAVGAAVTGLLNVTPEGTLAHLLEPVVGEVPHGEGLSAAAVGVIGSVTAVLGLFLAWLVYGSGRVDADSLEARLDPLPRTLLEGWYVDSAYEKALAAPSLAAARLTGWVDERGIDGLVNGIGVGVRRLASSGRLLQTGFVRSYGLAFLLGAVAILAWVGVRT
jgi:NADH-quinone oxidoreductase subunit L